ncbi:glycosyltransferase [Jatrophihabitans sp.]|jgi:glycosyltransferase involved in cell wall biosynthesis|uniref:glycosyltransferase n=1 Tax=Jatrophihabitans sp. TaxID=1932789 RepID=UPI002F04781D
MRILLWHVHGSWTTAFVQGSHDYVVPVLPDRGPDGVGRARTWSWPASVTEVPPAALREQDFDVVLLQRPHELDLVRRWLGREPGRELPAVYLEHNTPEEKPCIQRHILADRSDIALVHVTYFNELFWDNGRAPTTVIEHGIIDPGARYTGELSRAAVVVNEPGRRDRIVGADLVSRFLPVAPVDVFGMQAKQFAVAQAQSAGVPPDRLVGYEQEVPTQDRMHTELARRRAYLHLTRWTSLGLTLIEAMQLGMPVLALATTEAVAAVPPAAGEISTDVRRLVQRLRTFLAEPELARACGLAARAAALDRYGLKRFLADWDVLLDGILR